MTRRQRLVAGAVVSVAIIGVTFAYALPRLAGYGAVWRQVRGLGWWWLLALLGATAGNVATFALPWIVVLPTLGFMRALRMTQASTAFSLVMPGGAPLGMAASFAMLRASGLAGADVGFAVALTGIWNQVSTFLFPVAAVLALAAEGTSSPSLRLAAFIGVGVSAVILAIAAAMLWKPAFSQRMGDLAARVATRLRRRNRSVTWSGESLLRFRADLLRLVRRSWPALTVATLLNQLSGYLLFELSVRATGIPYSQVSVVESFAAWSLARLLTSLPLTPGGIGFVEVGLTGILLGFGAGHAAAVAAVLIYRGFSVVPTLVLGLLAVATWRRGGRRAVDSPLVP